jgi:hypothetical protein
MEAEGMAKFWKTKVRTKRPVIRVPQSEAKDWRWLSVGGGMAEGFGVLAGFGDFVILGLSAGDLW